MRQIGFEGGGHLMMATKNGLVKKTPLSAYKRPTKGGIIAGRCDASSLIFPPPFQRHQQTAQHYSVLDLQHDPLTPICTWPLCEPAVRSVAVCAHQIQCAAGVPSRKRKVSR